MKTNPISQHGAAVALVQLLEEHPALSKTLSWTIGRTRPKLTGVIHEGGMAVLRDCGRIVGGVVEVGEVHDQDGRPVQQHVLVSVWRDVQVEILVTLPVAESAQVAA